MADLDSVLQKILDEIDKHPDAQGHAGGSCS